MNTKERIIEAAVKLFNERGTKRVTTNHIAEAAGISPGNLYYHFRNKEEIIRAILELMNRVGPAEYAQIKEKYPVGSPEGMTETFLMIQKFNWRFRFFKRELSALIADDPELKRQFILVHRLHLDITRRSLEQAIDAGILIRMDANILSLLAEEIWMVNLFWLNYLEIGGEEVTDSTLERGIGVLRNIISRYAVTPA
ncbi:MAG: TetR/AcrR family transcriptional regulator [Acidobacteriota bacterium]